MFTIARSVYNGIATTHIIMSFLWATDIPMHCKNGSSIFYLSICPYLTGSWEPLGQLGTAADLSKPFRGHAESAKANNTLNWPKVLVCWYNSDTESYCVCITKNCMLAVNAVWYWIHHQEYIYYCWQFSRMFM